jgi:hypothetical protein
MAAQFAYEQHIVPKVYAVEELFRPEVIASGQAADSRSATH